VAERLKAAVLKTVVGISLHREFESHPHRFVSLMKQIGGTKIMYFGAFRGTRNFGRVGRAVECGGLATE
jgi:hypothetical protein